MGILPLSEALKATCLAGALFTYLFFKEHMG